MSVRHRILALLAVAPCYGFQLRTEIERRAVPPSRVNVGQIYSTLERLERDGFAYRGETDEHGHVFYLISEAGRALATEWLAKPVISAETVDHLAFALSLPGLDAAQLLAVQRASLAAELGALAGQTETSGMLETVVGDGIRSVIEAQLVWVDRCAALVSGDPGVFAYDLVDESPRRGRPVGVLRP